jgi:hypothetical protein
MDSDAFTALADRLCEISDLDRLEARGTIRIAFKKTGVEVKCIGMDELEAVFARVMPRELEARGCSDPQAICEATLSSLGGALPKTGARSSDEIMRRLGSA